MSRYFPWAVLRKFYKENVYRGEILTDFLSAGQTFFSSRVESGWEQRSSLAFMIFLGELRRRWGDLSISPKVLLFFVIRGGKLIPRKVKTFPYHLLCRRIRHPNCRVSFTCEIADCVPSSRVLCNKLNLLIKILFPEILKSLAMINKGNKCRASVSCYLLKCREDSILDIRLFLPASTIMSNFSMRGR